MKSTIREKRRLTLEGRRITPEIIRSLSKVIDKAINDLSPSEAVYIMYSIDASDNTSYESSSSDIFEDSKVMRKVISKIVMRFYTLPNNSKNIEIQIVHSQKNDKSENFILVSGDNDEWVKAVLIDLTEIVEYAVPQPKYNALGYVMFFSWIVFLVEYIRVVGSYIDRIPYVFIKFVVILGIPIASVILFILLFEYLTSLFPSIELQTGAEHLQLPAKKRKLTLWLAGAIFIPILLEIFIDILKSVF